MIRNTFKISSIFTGLLFFIWLLPLGIFIKPSQEKIACNGQRAICLCRTASITNNKPLEAGMSLKTAGASNHKETNTSSGGLNNYTLLALLKASQKLDLFSNFEIQYLSYKTPYLDSLEHVPKV